MLYREEHKFPLSLKLALGGKLVKTLKAPFYWGMLYPSSAIIDENDIYIAMREGILKVSDFEYNPEYEWFVKK